MTHPRVHRGLAFTRISFGGIVIVCSSLVAAVTIGGFLGTAHWALNVLSHFRLQYFICLSVAVIALLILRMRWAALASAIFAAVNLLVVLPLFFGKLDSTDSGQPVRVMLVNVNRWNSRADLVEECVREMNPDILVLQEVHAEWLNRLGQLSETYPYRKACPREDCFGMAMLSKSPLKDAAIEYLGTAGVPSVSAEVDIRGRSLFILGTHPLPPGSAEYARHRNEQLAAIPGFLKPIKLPVVLLGDLNASPWCPYFRKLLKDTGLVDSGRGYGIRPTWPSHNPLLRIPIDHCLVSPGIAVAHRQVGQYIGSDHYPLIVDLVP